MNNRMIGRLTLAAALALPLMAAASPEFVVYEGKNTIHEGQGGNRRTVEGVDFWTNGAPPRRFQVIGNITDRRMRSGIYGAIRMSNLDSEIAKVAKANGGDALIEGDSDDDVIGVHSGTSAYAYGGQGYAGGFAGSFAAPVKARVSRFTVVRYLPDAEPAKESITAPDVTPANQSPPNPNR